MSTEPQHSSEGLLLFGTIGCEAYLRPDGSVIWYEEPVGAAGYQSYEKRTPTPQERAGAINAGGRRHPELRELLPVRTADATCMVCRGTGTFIRPDGSRVDGVWCGQCVGLGYLVEGTT